LSGSTANNRREKERNVISAHFIEKMCPVSLTFTGLE
jgi:hypothetical protein